jgi:MFS family permease
MSDTRHGTSDDRHAAHTGGKTLVAAAGEALPSPGRAWYSLGVLTLVLLVATVDRSIPALLTEPLKRDLHINDTQVSLLVNLAFVAAYALLGLPISRLADVRSRRLIIGVGIAFWSAMTALCGMAGTYWQFFLARVAVGGGESALAPATYSILTDSFAPEKLPRATAILSMGFTAGVALASLVGGAVIQAIGGLTHFELPVIGTVRMWQMVFFAVGLPGLVVALLMATVVEPRRRGFMLRAGAAPGARARALPVKDVARFFVAEGATYFPMFAAMGIKTMLVFGTGFWLPQFFVRTYGWTIPQIAYAQGLVGLATSFAGLIVGGWLAERYARRGYDDANIRVLLIASILVLPTSVLFPLMPNAHLALALFGLNTFFASIGIGPANAALQIVTPNEMRGQIRAAYQFVFNVIGYASGGTLVAVFTNYVFRDDAALRYSLTTAAAIVSPIAILLTWWGLKPYARSYARARAWS